MIKFSEKTKHNILTSSHTHQKYMLELHISLINKSVTGVSLFVKNKIKYPAFCKSLSVIKIFRWKKETDQSLIQTHLCSQVIPSGQVFEAEETVPLTRSTPTGVIVHNLPQTHQTGKNQVCGVIILQKPFRVYISFCKILLNEVLHVKL